MRVATFLTMIAASLAIAACDSEEEMGEREDMPMAEGMPIENMPMSDNMPMMQSGEGGQTASAEGTVTAMDADAGTITIDHGPVAAVDWPAMTMAFRADEALRRQIAVGDAVTFSFQMSDGGSKITSISKK
jgi:Cu(I)/Ag(I) efflux system protein CusF